MRLLRDRNLEFIYRDHALDRPRQSRTRLATREEVQSSPVSRILLGTLAGAAATIPLGRQSPAGSSHLPAASPSRIIGRLFGVAPRRDCPFHPTRRCLVGHGAFAPHPLWRCPVRHSAFAPHPHEGQPLGRSSLTRLWRRACARRHRSTRLCCSDPHLTVGRRYLLRRSAESGLSSASLERRRGCPANFAIRSLGRAPGFQAHRSTRLSATASAATPMQEPLAPRVALPAPVPDRFPRQCTPT